MKIHKGDTVQIIAGNDRGKEARVLAVFPAEGRIVVEGVNVRKKHIRPRAAGQKGELVRFPAPFVSSRAMLVCSSCAKAGRVGYRLESGKKIRVCKKCGADV